MSVLCDTRGAWRVGAWPARVAMVAVGALLTIGAAVPARAQLSVVDDAGARVTLDKPARRIVSLAPHATELLFAAGAGDRVVGVVAHSDWPPEARALPRIGDANALDLERLLALAPDLVVAWPYTTPGQLGAVRARGVAVYVSDPKSMAGIAGDIEALGVLAGTRARADPAAAALRARFAGLAATSSVARPVSVFYEVWNEPLQTIGGRHLISEAIALCGGRNVFAGLALPAPTVSVEAVVAAAPEALLAGSDDGRRPAWLDDWQRWRDLPAVRLGNLFVANGDLLHRPGPRFADGVESLCATLAQARANRDRVR